MDFTKEMRESFATYAVRYWLTDLAADDPTNSRVRTRIYAALQRASIPLAVPATTAFVEIQDASRGERRAQRQLAERLGAIRTVSLFRHLTDDELTRLAEGMTHTVYAAGEIITRQGAIAHWLYILTSGKADIRATVEPEGAAPRETKVIATIESPDFFGEMGLMTGAPRLADVVATSEVECFRLDKASFEQVLLKRPEIVGQLSEKLAARRVELIAVRDGLDPGARLSLHASERERILGSIKGFFGL
jgi:CRP-like cAMP-binding protein